MRPATRTTGADIGLKERLAACRKKVICSSDTPASTLSVRRCWATSTTAIYAKGRTSASIASHPSTSSTRGYSWASPPWSDVRWGRRNRGSRACSSTRFTSSDSFSRGYFPSEMPPARFWLLSFSGPAVLTTCLTALTWPPELKIEELLWFHETADAPSANGFRLSLDTWAVSACPSAGRGRAIAHS